MLLTIDVGNTNTVFGIFDADNLIGTFRMSTSSERTSDELGMQILEFYSFYKVKPEQTCDIIVSSVVPQVMYSLNNACVKYLKKTPYVVGQNIDHGMVNLYINPSEVGADRLVNAVYAVKKYGSPLIIIDIGTATTFDAISKDGEYLGGAIFPGIKVSMEALFMKAAKLPRIDIVKPKIVIGTSTVTSLQSGAVNGYIGAINGIIQGMKSEMGSDVKVIATGGMGGMFSDLMENIECSDKDMTLEGLREIYKNR